MRKTPYVISFFTILLTFVFNVTSVRRADWLVTKSHSDVLHTTVTTSYGLTKACELIITRLPTGGGGDDNSDNGKITYRDYKCRPFPSQANDGCDKDNRSFCSTWTGAGYVEYLALGFSAVAPLAFLFGMSTHSRRRRIWRALVGLTMLQTVTGVIAFAMITDSFEKDRYPPFEHAKPGTAYVLSTMAWILSFLVTLGVGTTGLAAEKGASWAAGSRGYQPIDG
ncbi:hypothetical protein FA13DRAFT_1725966 [Coprinellus micaceus]|uniref:Uncharacterized protein n=1 Tax=Coprinellus micaceus TaxID=71717 RepID=A0A4Y7TVV0_COPMI|nr:hypothetical protein FA13DRAFT_1725966 [Coprinellus micaceus]